MVSTLSSLTFSLGVGVNFNPRLRRLISAWVRLYKEMFIIFGSTGLVSFSRGLCLLFLLKNGCDLLIHVVLFAASVDVDGGVDFVTYKHVVHYMVFGSFG